jgi:hypothetical protein
MGMPLRLFLCVIASALIIACADDDPQSPPPVVPTIVQNTTYNNNITYAYNTAAAASASAIAAPISAPTTPPTPSDTAIVPLPEAPPPSVKSPRISPQPGTPRDVVSTGIPVCDAYLMRVETCSHALLPNNDEAERGFERIQMSLDMSRRAWRQAALNKSERPELARTCTNARALYESSVENMCP